MALVEVNPLFYRRGRTEQAAVCINIHTLGSGLFP
jgi:hypothetical protein